MERNREIDSSLIQAMEKRISEIHQCAAKLKEMGRGIPVIEKNARCILSFTHVLKFGISDIVEVMDNQGE